MQSERGDFFLIAVSFYLYESYSLLSYSKQSPAVVRATTYCGRAKVAKRPVRAAAGTEGEFFRIVVCYFIKLRDRHSSAFAFFHPSAVPLVVVGCTAAKREASGAMQQSTIAEVWLREARERGSALLPEVACADYGEAQAREYTPAGGVGAGTGRTLKCAEQTNNRTTLKKQCFS